MAGANIRDYFDGLVGQTLPPYLLEVVLRSGRSFYVKNTFRSNPDLDLVVVRIWDLRTVEPEALLNKLNDISNRGDWEDFAAIDPALDQANLWIRIKDIEGLVEWHERFWPVAAPDQSSSQIGFFHHSDS